MVGPPKSKSRAAHGFRTFWVYRWLFLSAVLLGTLLWFILINSDQVTVYLPFGLGRPTASVGLIVLFSAGTGALAAVLLTGVMLALHRHHARPAPPRDEPVAQDLPEDRPPTDYAAKTTEGFPDAPWSAR